MKRDSADQGQQPFATRLKGQVIDPVVLAGLPVAAVLCLFRSVGLTAPIPYWFIVLLVVVAQMLSLIAAAAWADHSEGWRLPAYVGVVMAVIGVVAYSTGWGPILSLGFIFGAASAIEIMGSKATGSAMIWVVVCMAIGQLAIAEKVAPSLIREPLVNGLASLCLLGVLLTIALLGRSVSARERFESDLGHTARRFEALVQHASDIIIVVDESGQLQYVSPAFERALGTSREEFGPRPALQLMHPDDLAAMRADRVERPEQSEISVGEPSCVWNTPTVTGCGSKRH